MSDIKVGDRVRVTFEGVVKQTMGDYGARIHNDAGQWLAEFYYERDGASLEKIEPPVEVFKPGDVVRQRDSIDPTVRVLGQEGYLRLEDGRYFDYGDHEFGAYEARDFTSRQWEKVSIE